MNKVIVKRVKRAISLNLDEMAYHILVLHGAHLSKRDVQSIVKYMNIQWMYPCNVVRYVYYECAYCNGIDFDIRTCGKGLMMRAIQMRYFDTGILLLKDNRIGSIVRDYVIQYATALGYSSIVEHVLTNYTITEDAIVESIIVAAMNGYLTIVQLLVNDSRCRTKEIICRAIKVACAHSRIDIIKYLLYESNMPYDICSVDMYDFTQMAIRNGRTNIVRLLLDDERSDSGSPNLLKIAEIYNYKDIVDLLEVRMCECANVRNDEMKTS